MTHSDYLHGRRLLLAALEQLEAALSAKVLLQDEVSKLAWEIYVRDRDSEPRFCFERALQWVRVREEMAEDVLSSPSVAYEERAA